MTDAETVIDFAVVRFTAEGELDTSFGEDGWHIRSGGATPLHRATDIEPTADGHILVAGVNDDSAQFTVLRLNDDGTPDADFGASGLFTLDTSGAIDGNDTVSTLDELLDELLEVEVS